MMDREDALFRDDPPIVGFCSEMMRKNDRVWKAVIEAIKGDSEKKTVSFRLLHIVKTTSKDT